MKNKEKFEKEIIEIACNGHSIAVDKNGKVVAWNDGKTSYTTNVKVDWSYAKLPESEVQE